MTLDQRVEMLLDCHLLSWVLIEQGIPGSVATDEAKPRIPYACFNLSIVSDCLMIYENQRQPSPLDDGYIKNISISLGTLIIPILLVASDSEMNSF